MVILRLSVRSALPLGSPVVMLIVTQYCSHVIFVWWNCWRRGSGTDVLAYEWKPWMDRSCLFSLLSGPGQLLVRPEKVFQSIFCSNVVQYSSTPPPPLSLFLSHYLSRRSEFSTSLIHSALTAHTQPQHTPQCPLWVFVFSQTQKHFQVTANVTFVYVSICLSLALHIEVIPWCL